MRLLAFFTLLALAGCAGQLRDYVGPRSSIVTPQLIRYGLDLAQARCVGERLGAALTPLQLRLFVRAAGAVGQGYYEPARLTMRDLAWVASAMGDPGVPSALERATDACNAGDAAAVAGARPAPGEVAVRILGPGDLPPPSGAPQSAAVTRAPAWLNLGAAGSGQSIAIDASTIEQEGARRSAWFRLTDPGSTAPSADTFLLHIDCAGRTVNAKARRRHDAAGAVSENVEYPDNPLPAEGGTVMEIAFLSLCT